MESARPLRVRGLQASAEKPEEFSESRESGDNMRLPKRLGAHRRVLVCGGILGFLVLAMVSLAQLGTEKSSPVEWHVDTAHKKRVHEHVRRVLTGQCHPGSTRQSLVARLPTSSHLTQPFLWKDVPLTDDLFQYPPPFGFKGLQGKVENLLKQLPDSNSAAQMEKSKECRRCVVMGNGGILKGLELGQLIDKFDIIIRLNSGPLGEFSVDVGNRTSIRMSYPEGTPLQWVDTDPQTLFVAVVHKGGDISWTSAMINKHNTVPLWDRLFFWQKVPDQIPLEPERFRLLNPHVIRETALDLLKYLPPTQRLLGWDKNVPTLGVSALNLASLLCDEVSLAGFGYNLSQQGAPLHYYDHLTMSAMWRQKMHDVDRETQLLQNLVKDGTISDLTGGIHCSFCHS
ncbi:lactosylceramide alpha-2,3-sialyltransferase [Scomber japonicus]|uniref:lactosylceramide alpha-2,3-sialyltransferase n=1 Tax=Scomber japonicus TaxID=13676 RepID=UPI002306D817|nr:lactosylceramide alpha-2,3-sialyltransferase [Scomber japonicus]